ncbi:MAG: glycosyltransferase [Roseovarius sp.]|nr:glycosyltransferase [Roseovarius sp.]
MTDPPLISVIVPVHDVADHVSACLDSLRVQTHADFEALVIDDGATDATATRAAEAMAGDPRFRLIAQDHGGLSAARNAGLDAARGRFIAFVDGDDRVMPDFLARLLRVLERTGGDWAACALRYCFPDDSGATHSAIHTAPALDAHPALCRHALATWPDAVAHFPSAWNKLYRRSLIGDLRFDEGTWFEDHAFFLRVAARTDHLWHLAEPLYLQTRGRVGQITGRDDDRVFQTFDVLDRMRDIFTDSPRSGGDAALATLAQRLIGERAEVLASPGRRARFARRAAAYLGDEVDNSPDPCWREEMRWAAPAFRDPRVGRGGYGCACHLARALAEGAARGQEVLIVCPDRDAANRVGALRRTETMRVLVQAGQGAAAAEATGLEAARGAVWRSSRGQVTGLIPTGSINGPCGCWTRGPISALSARLADTDALADPRALAAHLFRRDLLEAHRLHLDPADRDGRALCLGAALAAGRVIALPGPATLARLAPALPARALLAEHDARINSLPAPLAAGLPEGWQRRLFLRALWQNWCAAQHWPRPRRRVMVLAALAGALRRGYRAATPPPAGLDPGIPAPHRAVSRPAPACPGRSRVSMRTLPPFL